MRKTWFYSFTQRFLPSIDLNPVKPSRSFHLSNVRSDHLEVSVCEKQIIDRQCIMDMCVLPTDIIQPNVVIIGGGMAGLSAAQRLAQCGLTNFKILEASERAGGRLKSCWMGDCMVELGVPWISGASVANPVFTIAAQEKLFMPPLKRVKEPWGLYFTSEGRAVDMAIATKAKQLFNLLRTRAAQVYYATDPPEHTNLQDFMMDMIMCDLCQLPEPERFDLVRLLNGMTSGLRASTGEDLCRVGLREYGSMEELPGGNVTIDLGMSGVLAPLLRDLPAGAIEYQTRAVQIRWGVAGNQHPRAIVTTDDGRNFGADYVLVTVSLGVLKMIYDSFFCPGLPAPKAEAIEKLGFGHVNRYFLEFESPFWVGSGGGILLAWTGEELQTKDSWVKGITWLTGVPDSSKVLGVTVAGPEAEAMEHCPDCEVVRQTGNLLRRFMGNAMLPPVVGLLRSTWSTHPFFKGAFTFMGLDSHSGHIKDLAEPLPSVCCDMAPILLFAGEATSKKHFSTLHGARETGIREAERILNLTHQFRGPPVPSIKCPETPDRPCPS